MKRKIFALLLATIMLLSVAVGCKGSDSGTSSGSTGGSTSTSTSGSSSSTASQASTAPEQKTYSPMTFTTITTSQDVVSNPDTDLFSKALKEKFNITLKIDYIAQSALEETLKLRFAGNEDPDVMFNVFGPYDRFGVDGYFVAFDDYWDKLPNYRAQWRDEDWETYLELAAAPDGKHYSLRVPMGNVQLVGAGWLFRMSTINKLNNGYVPATTDELYDYLKKIKQAYPDSIPISNRNKIGGLTGAFEDAFRTDIGFQYDEDYGQFVYCPVTDKFRDMLIYLNKLYKEDLIAKEFATQSAEQWSEQVGQGKVHVLLEYFAREGWANNLCAEVDPEANWTSSDKFINAYPDKKLFVTRYSVVGESSARISSRNTPERIERLLEVFDWLATEEGQIKTQFGEEGVTYRVNDKGELEYLDHIITPLHPDKGTDTLLKYNLDYRIVCNPRYFYYQGGGPSTIIGDKVRANNYDYWKHYNLVLSEEDRIVETDYRTVITDKMLEHVQKFITGQLDPNDDATWNQYVKTINDSGLTKLLPIYQREYAKKYGK